MCPTTTTRINPASRVTATSKSTSSLRRIRSDATRASSWSDPSTPHALIKKAPPMASAAKGIKKEEDHDGDVRDVRGRLHDGVAERSHRSASAEAARGCGREKDQRR